ncbi:MAG: tetratricopeptide repeat protein [Polyangiaceae bacterium]|jgi:tetratricopeptide (TPR) repeat protein
MPAPPDDSGKSRKDENDDAKDRAHWEAVDEATELLHEERFREALVSLRNVATRNPQNPYAFYFIGVALFEMGEMEPARDAYRAALRLAPKHLGARVALTHILRQLGDLREALKEGTTALAQAPGDADALHAIGLVHLARGDDAAARRYFEAFLASSPELEAAMEVRGILDGLDKGLS